MGNSLKRKVVRRQFGNSLLIRRGLGNSLVVAVVTWIIHWF